MNPSTAQLERVIVVVGVLLGPIATLHFDAFFFTASDLLLCVSLGMLLLDGRLPKAPLGAATILWMIGAALLMLGLLGSSLLRGVDPARAAIIVAQYLFAYVVMLWVVAGRPLADTELLAKAFVLGVAAISLHGVVIFYTVGYQPDSIVVSGRRRLNTVLGDANLASSIVSLILPLLFYLWMQGRVRAWLAVPLLALFATTIVLTGSFSGLALAVFALAIFLLVTMSRPIFLRLAMVAVAGAVFFSAGGDQFLPEAFRDRVLNAVVEGDLEQAGTFEERLGLIHEAIGVIRDRGILLVGLGADQFRAISEIRAPVHNLYLLLWTEGGVFALLGWCLMLMTIVLLALAARMSGAPSALPAQALATTVILALGANATAHLYARYWILPPLISVSLLLAGVNQWLGKPSAGQPRLSPMIRAATAGILCVLLASTGRAAEPLSDAAVRQTMRSAGAFMRDRVAPLGGYAWSYKADLSERRGEGEIQPLQGWVQPPGIPAVGTAFLQAWDATGDSFYLEAARDAANMLELTQVRSGGWWYMAEFDPTRSTEWCYRILRDCKARATETRGNRERDASTLDDNNTQSALAFLIRMDQRLGGLDLGIRQAVDYGLAQLLERQYANGAWPLRFDYEPVEGPSGETRASYPSAEALLALRIPIHGKLIYTTNDHLMRDTIRVLLLAHQVYGRSELLAAAERGGEFLLNAQLPEPQPAWAQHYDRNMHPMWGRKFEPPAVASRETAGVIDVLMDLWSYTGDERWLKPIPAAAKWLQKSRLPDGMWSRFYELPSNRPLYMTTNYELTYQDDDLPTHYGFKSEIDIPEALARWERLSAAHSDAERRAVDDAPYGVLSSSTADEFDGIIAGLDSEGRWVEDGRIKSATFVTNMGLLADALASRDGKVVSAGHIACEIRPRRADRAICLTRLAGQSSEGVRERLMTQPNG